MNLMVNPTITGFRQDVDGTIKELKLGEAKEDAFANIIEQGGADLDDNKAATINVSTYTQPVEITPTSGKDGMKKATITLSNIPSPGTSIDFYAWKNEEETIYKYTLSETPSAGDAVYYNAHDDPSSITLSDPSAVLSYSDGAITFGDESNPDTAERDPSGDLTFTKV